MPNVSKLNEETRESTKRIEDIVETRIQRLLLPQYWPSEQDYEEEIVHVYHLFQRIENKKLREYISNEIKSLRNMPSISLRGRIINSLVEALSQVSLMPRAHYLLFGQQSYPIVLESFRFDLFPNSFIP
jgi:hypothetical protein